MSDTTTGHNRISTPLPNIEISEKVALFIRKFAIQALNFAITEVNSRFQVNISRTEDPKKWYASVMVDGEGGTNEADSQKAYKVLETYLGNVTWDEPLTLEEVTPESLRDDKVLKGLALKEKIFYFIDNLSRSIYADYPDAAWNLYSFILGEDGEDVDGTRRVTAAAIGKFYNSNPSDESFIKSNGRRLKAFVEEYKRLFLWEAAPDERVGYGYVRIVPNQLLRVARGNATPQQTLRSRASTPNSIRKSLETGSPAQTSVRRSSTPNPVRQSQNPQTGSPVQTSIPMAPKVEASVTLVYWRDNLDGRNRVQEYLKSLCRVTESIEIKDRAKIHMCKTAWPMLSASMANLKVRYEYAYQVMTIFATGAPDDVRSFLERTKNRIKSIKKEELSVPIEKRTVGLLNGIRNKSKELLLEASSTDYVRDDEDTDTAPVASDKGKWKGLNGYTSCFVMAEDIGRNKVVKHVIVSFLPPVSSTANVDYAAERHVFDSLSSTISDMIASYHEEIVKKARVRPGINIAVTKSKFSLYDVLFEGQYGQNYKLCGDQQSVLAARDWLVEVPAAEKVVSQPFKVINNRLAFLLSRRQHANDLAALKRAVLNTSVPRLTRRVEIVELTNRVYAETTLFFVQGPTALVEAAIENGRNFESSFQLRLMEKLLFENMKDEDRSVNFLKNEGSNLIRTASNENGIWLKYVAASASPVETLLLAKLGAVEISVAKGDIVQIHCDAIVNPANTRLKHDSGAARAISDAAGPQLNAECASILLRQSDQRVPLTDSVATKGYNLAHAKIVVHSVGPMYSSGLAQREDLFVKTVTSALSKAVENGASDIALPLMGSGVFGWPQETAANLLVAAVSKWVGSGNTCKSIRLIDVDGSKSAAFVDAVQRFNASIPNLTARAIVPYCPPQAPQFAWYWEIFVHDKDINGCRTVYEHKDHVKMGGRRFMPYDYDQVLNYI